MKVYLIEDVETGERRKVYGKGTRVYISKSAAINSWRNGQGKRVVEYELVATGENWVGERT